MLGSTRTEASKTDICSTMHRNSVSLRSAHHASTGPASPRAARKPPLPQRPSAAASEERRIARRVSVHPAALRHGFPLGALPPHSERGSPAEQQAPGRAAWAGSSLPQPRPALSPQPPRSPIAACHPALSPSLLPWKLPLSARLALSCPLRAPPTPAPSLRLRPGFSSGRSFTEGYCARAAPRACPVTGAAAALPPFLARSVGPVSWRRRRRSWRWTSKGTRRPCPERRRRGE